MAEYIDRDAFVTHERTWYCDNCDRRKNSKGKTVYEIGEAPCRACNIGDVLDALEDYPATDVRHVVLCRDCKWWETSWTPRGVGDGRHYCAPLDLYPSADWFCADGEKMEES